MAKINVTKEQYENLVAMHKFFNKQRQTGETPEIRKDANKLMATAKALVKRYETRLTKEY